MTYVGLVIPIDSQQNPVCNLVTSHSEEVTAAGQSGRSTLIALSGFNHFSEVAQRLHSSGRPCFKEIRRQLNLCDSKATSGLSGQDHRGKPSTGQGQAAPSLKFLLDVKMGGVGGLVSVRRSWASALAQRIAAVTRSSEVSSTVAKPVCQLSGSWFSDDSCAPSVENRWCESFLRPACSRVLFQMDWFDHCAVSSAAVCVSRLFKGRILRACDF